MKKGRPGVLVTVIAPPARREAIEELLFRETTTLGVRRQEWERTALEREIVTVATAYGSVRVKVGRRGGVVYNAQPEFEDCQRLAAETGVAGEGSLGGGALGLALAGRKVTTTEAHALPDDADLLRQRRAARGARLHDDRGRRADARAPARRPRRVLADRHRRARPEHRAHRPRARDHASSSTATRSPRSSASCGTATTSATTASSARPTSSTSAACCALWEKLREAKTPDGQDAVYSGKYAGWYCPRCEAFKDEDELRQPGNLCPDHERPCEWTEEENFFFRLSAYEDWLRQRIESDALRIDPESRRNEVLGVIRQGLQDFSVSRARVKWGIPVPEQPDHVLYVWVDALSNYITALGFADDAPDYRHYWAGADERLHLIGKEIIRFHCLYWPAMLYAAGVPVPTREFAQGYITKNGKKLSKTTGNVIDPVALVERLRARRGALLPAARGRRTAQDWDFTDAAFVARYNADLANDLGNLVSRALTMVAAVLRRQGAAARRRRSRSRRRRSTSPRRSRHP